MVIKEDLLLKAAYAGTLAALLADLSLYLINLFIPGPTINMPQLSAEFFLNIENYTFVHTILGVIWSTVGGSTYALFYLVALEKTGWNNLWIKAIIIISGLWLLGGGFVMRLMEVGAYVRDNPLAVAAFYIAHLLFATYLSFIVSRFSQTEQ